MALFPPCKKNELKFEFKKIEEIIHIYDETRENADEAFQLVYDEAVTLINKFGTEEK